MYNVMSGWKRDCRVLRESNDQEGPKNEGCSTCKKALLIFIEVLHAYVYCITFVLYDGDNKF